MLCVFLFYFAGMGKTFAFCFLPFLFHLLSSSDPYPLLVIISPLLALMEDQVRHMSAMGIPAIHFTGNTKLALLDSAHLVYISPELAVTKLRSLLRHLKTRLKAIVVDEAHCIPGWYVIVLLNFTSQVKVVIIDYFAIFSSQLFWVFPVNTNSNLYIKQYAK